MGVPSPQSWRDHLQISEVGQVGNLFWQHASEVLPQELAAIFTATTKEKKLVRQGSADR